MGESVPTANYLGTVELRIPAKPEWVAVARLTIAAIANRLPFTVEEIEDLKLAIAEACTNAIVAGGRDTIEIRCETTSDHLRIFVQDAGEPQAEPPRQPAAPAEGLGIFLIQALMDSVEHSAEPERGSELVMTKRVGS